VEQYQGDAQMEKKRKSESAYVQKVKQDVRQHELFGLLATHPRLHRALLRRAPIPGV